MKPTFLLSRGIGDIVLGGVSIAFAILLFIGAADLPPPRFEPLGSAAAPRILAGILVLLGSLVIWRAMANRRLPHPSGDDMTAPPAHPLRGLWTLLALVAYVAALDVLRAPFAVATALFLAAIALILTGGNRRAGVVYGGVGLVLGQTLATIFARFLYITIS